MMAADRITTGAAILAAVVVLAWIGRRGVAGAASDAGAAVVNAAGGAVSGAVGAVSSGVGIPTPAQTTTDARVARWIIDQHGYMTASMWSGAPALFAAMGMAPGTGTPPPASSAAGMALGVALPTTGDFSRMDRAASWQGTADTAEPWRLGPPGWDGIP